jgi:hypothetical protein
MERSRKVITKSDLRRLLKLAKADISDFFERNDKYKENYQGKEVLVALCQGAALHFIDKRNGVKDFDVWFFYPWKDITLPYRRKGIVDFGKSKFGKRAHLKGFAGRTIDVLMRSDVHFNDGAPDACLQAYLAKPKTETARLLGQKAVVGLYPQKVFGKVLWPKIALTKH